MPAAAPNTSATVFLGSYFGTVTVTPPSAKVVIEISPLSFLPPPEGELAELSHRLWDMQRDAVRGRFARAGIPVAVWGDESSLAAALEEVSTYRRQARALHV